MHILTAIFPMHLAVPLSGNNLGQVVHTHVFLSPSGIIWYWERTVVL